ncbi:MAG: WbqC family protein [Betaproteobacteria bacterium]
MSTRVVVSQPMYFPWPGIFEQVRLADIFVHYDDVQFPQGRSFTSRVQIRTPEGARWLTVPVLRALQDIREVRVDSAQDWRRKHLATLRQFYGRAPHVKEMLALAESVLAQPGDSLSDINRAGIEAAARHLGLKACFLLSSELAEPGRSSDKLLGIVRRLGGDVYITGQGARNYLDHELFERHGVRVEYMDYKRVPYPQVHGGFDPHVSVLDLIANMGREGAGVLQSGSVPWREFLAASEPKA